MRGEKKILKFQQTLRFYYSKLSRWQWRWIMSNYGLLKRHNIHMNLRMLPKKWCLTRQNWKILTVFDLFFALSITVNFQWLFNNAKPFSLSLSLLPWLQFIDRVRVCEWIRKLRGLRSDKYEEAKMKNEYMQFLRVSLAGEYHVLMKPFSLPPPSVNIIPLAECIANKTADAIPDLPRCGVCLDAILVLSFFAYLFQSFRKWNLFYVTNRKTIALSCVSNERLTMEFCAIWLWLPIPSKSRINK